MFLKFKKKSLVGIYSKILLPSVEWTGNMDSWIDETGGMLFLESVIVKIH